MKFLGYLSFMLLIIVGCKQSKDASELFSSKWKVFHHVDHEKCRLDTIEKIPGSMQGKQGFIKGKTIRMSDLRQDFALPKSLSGAKHIVSRLYFLDGSKHNMPEDGGDWYYLINGKKYYLRDHGGWDMSEKWSNKAVKGRVLRFELPVKAIL